MLNLNNITLVCIDGRTNSEEILQSYNALKYSLKSIEFQECLFFTSNPFEIGDSRITNIPTSDIDSLSGYNFFVLKELHKHIQTEFVLIVQYDGFIVNPDKWNPECLKYDYVGAPWPAHWRQSAVNRIGNGGFSLRSKKLLELTQNIYSSEPEDNTICLIYKDYMDKNGILFSPLQLASQFSFENPTEFDDIGNTFGFHGRHLPIHKQYISLANG